MDRGPVLRRLLEAAEILGATVIVAVLVKTFVIDAVHVPSSSMENTVHAGDFLLVQKLVYGPSTPRFIPLTGFPLPSVRFPVFARPRTGDVIVFRFSDGPDDGRGSAEQLFVKRLIGLPGQRVEIRSGRITVDGSEIPLFPEAKQAVTPDFGPVTVPADRYFVLGDNLSDSFDSRSWGTVPADALIGKAFLVYWSVGSQGVRWSRIGTIVR